MKKYQFSIDKNKCIGNGQQSVVYTGTFGQSTVAMKTIRLYNTISKDTYEEIDILKSIDHKNFISLMGVCLGKKEIYLLSEYFAGTTLTVLIDDEYKRKEYQLSGNKNHIVLELTDALRFLQDRENPMHRDSKLDNVLVNKHHELKICDLGLSEFTLTQTSLRKTIGRRPVGNRVYCAPEIRASQDETRRHFCK